MGRTGSHEEMVSLTPKTQRISLIKMSGPVLLACELRVDCWEVLYLYLFIYLKMAILMICYYLGFFPLQWDLAEGTPQALKGCDQHCAEGVPFHGSLHCVCCSSQAPCLLKFTFNWFSPEALSCLKCPAWEKRGSELCSVEAFELLWEACSGCWQWQEFPPWPRVAGIMAQGKAQSTSACMDGQSLLTQQLLCFAWRTLLALGICCCCIFVMITGVKGNQGLVFFLFAGFVSF